MRSAADAVALVRKAWTLRCETMKAPPALEAEMPAIVERVRAQLVEAVAICRETGASRELSVALGKLGHVEQDAGRHEAARACYEEAVAAARAVADPLRLAHAVRHLGDVHRHARRLTDAEACYEEALSLYGRHAAGAAALDHANALRPMAILKEELGHAEEARVLWGRARELYGAAGIEAGVAECADHLAGLDGRAAVNATPRRPVAAQRLNEQQKTEGRR